MIREPMATAEFTIRNLAPLTTTERTPNRQKEIILVSNHKSTSLVRWGEKGGGVSVCLTHGDAGAW